MIDPILDFIFTNLDPLIRIIIYPGITFIMLFTIFAVWYQRKFLARLMLRMGPVHAGKFAGWLQLIADSLKLLTKEIIFPEHSYKKLFLLSAITLPVIPAAAIALVPFAPGYAIFNVRGYTGILFLAIMSLYPIFIVLMGWASNNKFTLIGAFRTIYLDVAGEIPLFLAALGVFVWAGTYDLQDIVAQQATMWFVIPQFLGFLVFFISYFAMIEKAPLDIPEAETELVFGYRTEYTGALFLDTMLGDYINVLAWALMMIKLYFGGYNGPAIFADPVLNGAFWILFKLIILLAITYTVIISYARLRIDQAIRLGWYYLIPLALLNLIITVILKYVVLEGGA